MTQNQAKNRKHQLKRQQFLNRLALAGVATMATGAIALSANVVSADEVEQLPVSSSQVTVTEDTSGNSDTEQMAQVSSESTVNSNQESSQEEAVQEATPNATNDLDSSSSQDNKEVVKADSSEDVSLQPTTESNDVEQDKSNDTLSSDENTVKRASVSNVVERKSANASVARGDDYPANLKNAAPDSVIDPWRLFNRECTSFTAWRLSSVNDFTIPGAYGNGGQWGPHARRDGYVVDNNPALGSVAWLDDGSYGHVAWVSNVMGDTIEVEEYNYGYNHNYHKRVAPKSSFSGFIHFKDLPTTPSVKRYNVNELASTTGQSLSDGDYHIVLAANPEYGVDASGQVAGANIQLYKNVNDDGQVFSIKYLGNGFYKISQKSSGLVLDVNEASKENGANVQLWADTNGENQQWIIKQSDGSDTYEIVSRNGGLDLDVAGGKFVDNANLQVYSPSNSAFQKFKFIAVDKDARPTITDGDYHIVSALDDNLGLDVAEDSNQNAANVRINLNTRDDNQIFHVEYLKNGYYKITAKKSGKVLDNSGNGSYNKNNIIAYDSNNADNQQWIIKPSNYIGAFEIAAKNKNKVLDVEGASTAPNTNVHLFVRNGGKNQAWKFIPVKKNS